MKLEGNVYKLTELVHATKLRHWVIVFKEPGEILEEFNVDRAEKEKAKVVFGLCKYETGELWINNAIKGKITRDTIVHEMCHALEWEYNIDMTNRVEAFPVAVSSYSDEIVDMYELADKIVEERWLNE